MRPSDFFTEAEDPLWGSTRLVFDATRVDRMRLQAEEDVADLDVAQNLTQITNDNLVSFGTGGGEQLSNEDMAVALRSLRAILGRLGIKFEPPFRDLSGFKRYWISHDMSNSYAARRNYLAELFDPVFVAIQPEWLGVGGWAGCG